MSAAFDLLALGLRRKDLALQIARAYAAGKVIDPNLVTEFEQVDREFRTEQIRLDVVANKPRPRSRY